MGDTNIGAANIQKIRLLESSEPATPPSGYTYIWLGSNKKLHIKDDNGLVSELRTSISSYALIRDEKTQGTGGGTATSGAWQTRTFNTIVSDVDGICSLPGSNLIQLEPGTYQYAYRAPAFDVNANACRLYNTTASAVVPSSESMSTLASGGGDGNTVSMGFGIFTLSVQSTIRLEHRVTTTVATNGFGYPANFQTEVYSVIEFWKVG